MMRTCSACIKAIWLGLLGSGPLLIFLSGVRTGTVVSGPTTGAQLGGRMGRPAEGIDVEPPPAAKKVGRHLTCICNLFDRRPEMTTAYRKKLYIFRKSNCTVCFGRNCHSCAQLSVAQSNRTSRNGGGPRAWAHGHFRTAGLCDHIILQPGAQLGPLTRLELSRIQVQRRENPNLLAA